MNFASFKSLLHLLDFHLGDWIEEGRLKIMLSSGAYGTIYLLDFNLKYLFRSRRYALMRKCMTIGVRVNVDDYELRTLALMYIVGRALTACFF